MLLSSSSLLSFHSTPPQRSCLSVCLSVCQFICPSVLLLLFFCVCLSIHPLSSYRFLQFHSTRTPTFALTHITYLHNYLRLLTPSPFFPSLFYPFTFLFTFLSSPSSVDVSVCACVCQCLTVWLRHWVRYLFSSSSCDVAKKKSARVIGRTSDWAIEWVTLHGPRIDRKCFPEVHATQRPIPRQDGWNITRTRAPYCFRWLPKSSSQEQCRKYSPFTTPCILHLCKSIHLFFLIVFDHSKKKKKKELKEKFVDRPFWQFLLNSTYWWYGLCVSEYQRFRYSTVAPSQAASPGWRAEQEAISLWILQPPFWPQTSQRAPCCQYPPTCKSHSIYLHIPLLPRLFFCPFLSGSRLANRYLLFVFHVTELFYACFLFYSSVLGETVRVRHLRASFSSKTQPGSASRDRAFWSKPVPMWRVWYDILTPWYAAVPRSDGTRTFSAARMLCMSFRPVRVSWTLRSHA